VSYFGARFGLLRTYMAVVEPLKPDSPDVGQKKMIARSCRIHRPVPMTALMNRLFAILVVLVAAAPPAHAADEAHACLSKTEQRAAISTG